MFGSFVSVADKTKKGALSKMAEFCLSCFNKYMIENSKPLKERDVILCDDWCEECKAWKPCVVMLKPKTFGSRIKRRYNITKSRIQMYIQYIKERHKK